MKISRYVSGYASGAVKILIALFFVTNPILPVMSAPGQLPAPKGEIEFFVPCGLIYAFKEVLSDFRAGNPRITTTDYYDNAINLVRKIINDNKRPDIIISPGETELGLLREKGLIDESSITPFAEVTMVLVVPVKNRAGIMKIEDMTSDAAKTLSLADPRFNSVGYYAKQVLDHYGIFDKIKNKTIFTDNPIMAVNYVGKNRADALLHYKTCPFQTAVTKLPDPKEKYWLVQDIPVEAHDPIYFYFAVLKDARNRNAAMAFRDYLMDSKTIAKMNSMGVPRIFRKPPVRPVAGEGGKASGQPAAAGAAGAATSAEVKFGVPIPAGKVVVECYYPFNEEHEFMKAYLKTLEAKFPGKVKVRVIDFRDDDGYLEWRRTGLTCGAVFINKEHLQKFTLNGEEKTIDFQKRMEVYWTSEELEAAIQNHIDKL
ncbi:MAG: molybdate ABC transporter substrate-binding protein [Candidatus Wallbacteria bacterium HGW-Wallbacteria-1]|jgi:molybdate transport system substrate-binding protein|uniref:Molybdate ABC transporter substrate-binding protein n=1 Tax=Candidatus Wallbacteria bacterium HGW-Wallbacteria-1 TaxID=2013854 RepID=A0A2N1PL87_9BACT|nr:MAG: molybdate ABC transporter substrate-binding protein [Candidatus Wallbacteria bacterium HGW-Wallbacteria-1]